jgi:hypothetical protein
VESDPSCSWCYAQSQWYLFGEEAGAKGVESWVGGASDKEAVSHGGAVSGGAETQGGSPDSTGSCGREGQKCHACA